MTGHRSNLYILSAPSGAGKSSLAKALFERLPGLAVSVSHTTRPPRPGERDGVHYHFVDRSTFEAMVARGEFLEHALVFGNAYGTARAPLEAQLKAGKGVVLDIDWQGARAIKQQMPQAVGIFILPPSLEDLRKRLVGRRQDAPEVIERRMRAAIDEMRHYAEFDRVIVNDDFEQALNDLIAIIQGRPQAARPVGLNISALLAIPPHDR